MKLAFPVQPPVDQVSSVIGTKATWLRRNLMMIDQLYLVHIQLDEEAVRALNWLRQSQPAL